MFLLEYVIKKKGLKCKSGESIGQWVLVQFRLCFVSSLFVVTLNFGYVGEKNKNKKNKEIQKQRKKKIIKRETKNKKGE